MAMYFELESPGYVSFCVQNETQKNLGDCSVKYVNTTNKTRLFPSSSQPLAPNFPPSNGGPHSSDHDSDYNPESDSVPAIGSNSDDHSDTPLISTDVITSDPETASPWMSKILS